MKYIVALSISVLLLIFAKQSFSQDSLQTTATGIRYRIVSPHSGHKIQLNHIVTLNIIQKNYKDSLLFSSYASTGPLKIQVRPTENVTDLMDIFQLLNNKDSVIVYFPSDSLFTNKHASRPAYLPKGSSIILEISIEMFKLPKKL